MRRDSHTFLFHHVDNLSYFLSFAQQEGWARSARTDSAIPSDAASTRRQTNSTAGTSDTRASSPSILLSEFDQSVHLTEGCLRIMEHDIRDSSLYAFADPPPLHPERLVFRVCFPPPVSVQCSCRPKPYDCAILNIFCVDFSRTILQMLFLSVSFASISLPEHLKCLPVYARNPSHIFNVAQSTHIFVFFMGTPHLLTGK